LEFAALSHRQVRLLIYSSERPNSESLREQATRATHTHCCLPRQSSERRRILVNLGPSPITKGSPCQPSQRRDCFRLCRRSYTGAAHQDSGKPSVRYSEIESILTPDLVPLMLTNSSCSETNTQRAANRKFPATSSSGSASVFSQNCEPLPI
jgi:hypothetical protein